MVRKALKFADTEPDIQMIQKLDGQICFYRIMVVIPTAEDFEGDAIRFDLPSSLRCLEIVSS